MKFILGGEGGRGHRGWFEFGGSEPFACLGEVVYTVSVLTGQYLYALAYVRPGQLG